MGRDCRKWDFRQLAARRGVANGVWLAEREGVKSPADGWPFFEVAYWLRPGGAFVIRVNVQTGPTLKSECPLCFLSAQGASLDSVAGEVRRCLPREIDTGGGRQRDIQLFLFAWGPETSWIVLLGKTATALDYNSTCQRRPHGSIVQSMGV